MKLRFFLFFLVRIFRAVVPARKVKSHVRPWMDHDMETLWRAHV